jgi:hypothetical protein
MDQSMGLASRRAVRELLGIVNSRMKGFAHNEPVQRVMMVCEALLPNPASVKSHLEKIFSIIIGVKRSPC